MDHTLTEDMVGTIEQASRKTTGFRRRQFMAQMALMHCDGSARKALARFGWRREAVHTRLQQKRTRLRCVENFRARGRRPRRSLPLRSIPALPNPATSLRHCAG